MCYFESLCDACGCFGYAAFPLGFLFANARLSVAYRGQCCSFDGIVEFSTQSHRNSKTNATASEFTPTALFGKSGRVTGFLHDKRSIF